MNTQPMNSEHFSISAHFRTNQNTGLGVVLTLRSFTFPIEMYKSSVRHSVESCVFDRCASFTRPRPVENEDADDDEGETSVSVSDADICPFLW